MNAAPLHSKGLQRVLRVLLMTKDHPISTLELSAYARTCVASTRVSELRQHGIRIEARPKTVDGERLWYYRLPDPDSLELARETINGELVEYYRPREPDQVGVT